MNCGISRSWSSMPCHRGDLAPHRAGQADPFHATYRIRRPDLPSVTCRGAHAETVHYFPDNCPLASTRDLSQNNCPIGPGAAGAADHPERTLGNDGGEGEDLLPKTAISVDRK